MSLVKIWIHVVWSTKNREPFFSSPILRRALFDHIVLYGETKNIRVDFVNGYTDHVHALIALRSTQTIADVVKTLKGESSHWLKQEKIVPDYFAWQTDYFAVSVSESMVDRVRAYIKNQERHHQTKTSAEEYEEMLEKYGFTGNESAGLKPGAEQ